MIERQSVVMIIEDDPDIRGSFAELLEDEGYRVAQAGNGQEALDQLRAGIKPRLILVDMMMPVMDGAAFCSAFHADASLEKVPLFIVSASAITQERSVACGAAGFLSKPVGFSQLLDLAERYAGSAAAA